MRKHRVLVVDDSASMRHLISSVLLDTPDIEVVGHAADALEAREAIKKLNPDVVTLDVEMPKMNGIEFLEKLMRLRPTPVIMVSNFTSTGGELTVKALAIGAVDCIGKPQPGDRTLFAGLTDKVRLAADVRFRPPAGGQDRADHAPVAHGSYKPDGRIIAIGSSAGGVEALSAVLDGFPANCPPIVITQHMPEMFTKSLAARLDRLCEATVTEAVDGAPLDIGRVYVAPGGPSHLTVTGTGSSLRCRLVKSPLVSGHRPSVDVLFQSVAKVVGTGAIGVILSGMGRDGADGLLTMRKSGARTIGQDAATSFIYGMPRTAHEAGGVERQLPLKKIGAELLTMTNQKIG